MRRFIHTRPTWKTTLPAALFAAVALVVASAPAASAAPAASVDSTNSCWLDVVNDWLDNGVVNRVYAIPCYTQAIQHLNAYSDVKSYSSATDDIQRALLAAIRQDRGNGPGAGSAGPTPGTGGGGGGSGSNGSGGGPTASGGGGIVRSLADRIGPGNAQSIPLPLLILGGLALLLLLSAGGTWLVRRLQAQRVTPAPAHVPLDDHR